MALVATILTISAVVLVLHGVSVGEADLVRAGMMVAIFALFALMFPGRKKGAI